MRYIALAIVLLAVLDSWAQQNLSGSIQHSPYTYVYKLDKKETEFLQSNGLYKLDDKYLHTLVDSFPNNMPVPALKAGNYLLVSAHRNKLKYELYTEGDLDVKIISNEHDAFVAVHTAKGELISNASVQIDKKQLPYHSTSKAYGPVKVKNATQVSVEHNNVLYNFPVSLNKRWRPSLFRKIAYSFPLKYVVLPIKKLTIQQRDRYRYPDYFNRPTPYEQNFKGFMVFNKPIYKPGDTIKLKAFVQTNKGQHLNQPLLLRLTDNSFSIDTILATIKPYRAGGYEYQFALTDSLDLDLDEKYMLTLETIQSKKYDLDNYEGDLDDDEYAIKRKVVMRGKFDYEEYELSSITFSARSGKKEHNRGEEVAIFLKAVDENEMTVMDGRVQILVKSESWRQREFHAPFVFLPDTLWHHSQPLENLGETKIIIPDSIFPRASFSYSIECTFLNSNNEMQTESLDQSFKDETHAISFDLQNDSLTINHRIAGKSTAATAMLYACNDEDTIEQRRIIIPVVIKVNPYATSYEVETDNLNESYDLKQAKGMVSALASRTKDSVLVQLVNPSRLPTWYTIFAGNKIVLRGYGDSLTYLAKSQTSKNYFISLQYIYANKVYKENYTIPFQEKLLSIQVKQPEYIYPGQKTTININVTDANGKPVPDADVTAFSFTKKFNPPAYNIPYLGKLHPYRSRYFNLALKDQQALEHSIKLNWERWSSEMNLDTIEYYKFLHPQNIYTNLEAAKDSITQVAPFVVYKGDLQPVYLLYIDEEPVFFSQAQHLKRYSFRIAEGKHSLRLRTRDKLITVDSVHIPKGTKTFISINADSSNRNVHIEKMPDSLSNYEKQLWSRYMFIIENNFGENLAYISQQQQLFLLNAANLPTILTGPLQDHWSQLVVKNKFDQFFEVEGNWQFNISKGLIKQRQTRNPYLFSSHLPDRDAEHNFRDLVLTVPEIDSLWQEYLDKRSSNVQLFSNTYQSSYNNGRLVIGFTNTKEAQLPFIKNVILFRYDNPDFIKVYTGNTRDFGYQEPGKYRILFLLKKDNYFIRDSIVIRKNGTNYYEIESLTEKQKDSISIKISRIIENRSNLSSTRTDSDLDLIKETFHDKYLNTSSFTETINGLVVDSKGKPLANASVIIKGTRVGTTTNAQGEFRLQAPPRGAITVSLVGYTVGERNISPGNYYKIVLIEQENRLSEVVVVGYGTSRKREASYSMSTVQGMDMQLQGRVAGIAIRGNATETATPLIIVDGLPYSGKLEDIDKDQLVGVKVLKPAEAVALYGSQAAAGAIIVTTKKQTLLAAIDQPFAGSTLRKNFKDDAYWQPRLLTDANGNASFNVSFPDDITNWRTYVIAMGNKKQTGYWQGFIRSYKALSGNIALPQFSIAGDSLHVIGKTFNYLPDSAIVKRSFYVNDALVKENNIRLRNSWIDTFSVVTASVDSIKLKYTIEKENGYFDGEERKIPVFQPGVLETDGFFAPLGKDTSFQLPARQDTSVLKLYAEASVLPALYAEAESIRQYEYLCNEQLASKLKAMLVQKSIDQYLKRPFNGEKNIRDLINKLNQNKSTSGLWDWWTGNDPSMWISLHVVEALAEAQQNGYTFNINKQALTDYLIYNFDSYRGTEKISSLYLLHALGAKTDYKKHIDSIEKHGLSSLFEKLRMVELKQKLGLAYTVDTFITKMNRTVFGNIYWGEENYHFFNTSIQNTLAMYRILKNAGGHDDILRRIRNYFLEKKKSGHWRNTYESSLILKTILPDILAENPESKPASLTINGKENFTIKEFPFYTEIKNGEAVTVSKQGAMPVYFTAYRQYWNKAPEKVEGNFVVNSFFERTQQTISKLKAGEPVVLKVNVSVKADADYVMIEIPIPAGCSYQDKIQPHWNGEVHREYFKNKVSIFCKRLPRGEYQYTVSLLPRFSGTYSLNPARAEMMYFPVFYGREGMKRVKIE